MSHTLDSLGRIKLAFGSGSVWPFSIITVSASGNADYTDLQDAIDGASAGDTLLLDAGTFSGDITINKALTLVGFSMFSTIISSSTANSQAVNITTDDVRLKNLSITSTGTGASAGCVLTSGISVTLDDCWLFKTSGAATVNYGLKAVSGGTTNLYGCLITVSGGTSNYGIYIDNASTVFCDRGYITATTLDLYVFHASAVLQLNSTVLAQNTVTNNGTITDLSNVSRVMQSDFQGVALSADATGNLSTAYNLTLTGSTKAILGSGSSVPDIGSTTLAAKFGNVYLGATKDFYAADDSYALFNRLVNYGFTPDEHWRQNADELAWTGYAAYTGFGTPSSLATTNSIYQIATTSTGAIKSFRYRAASTGDYIFLRARLSLTYGLSGGLMVDDGVNNADGNGANNFYRVYITQAAAGGNVNAVEQYRFGGGAVTTNTTTFTLTPHLFYGLSIRTSGTRWSSWGATPAIFGESGEGIQYTTGIASLTWTPARVGLYQVFVGNDGNRKAMYDWYDEATT